MLVRLLPTRLGGRLKNRCFWAASVGVVKRSGVEFLRGIMEGDARLSFEVLKTTPHVVVTGS
jgi:hypothetical protein